MNDPKVTENLEYAREALGKILSAPINSNGDTMIVEIATRLTTAVCKRKPTDNEIFLAVLVALPVERLRAQEGFAA